MTDQGSGGTTFFRCHICKQPVKMLSRLDAVHDDGLPICLEKTETSEHVAECMWPQTKFPCTQCWEIECECTCICERLRACEERVLEGRPDPGISEKQAIANHAIYQNGYEQGQHDCSATHAIRGLKDMNRIAARGYDEGQRDAIASAVQRVEALKYVTTVGVTLSVVLPKAAVIAAIKGDQQ